MGMEGLALGEDRRLPSSLFVLAQGVHPQKEAVVVKTPQILEMPI